MWSIDAVIHGGNTFFITEGSNFPFWYLTHELPLNFTQQTVQHVGV
jgi:hypothetical protein